MLVVAWLSRGRSSPPSRGHGVAECETPRGDLLAGTTQWLPESVPHMFPHSTDDSSETVRSQTRRRFLLGVGAVTATAAGCLGQSDESADGTTTTAAPTTTETTTTASFDPAPLPYGEWLTAADDGRLVAYADLDAVPSALGPDASLDGSLDDPLVTYPLVLSQTAVGVGRLRLSFAGLTAAVSPGTESQSTVSEVTVLDRTTVATGQFATDALDERLVEPSDQTWGIAYEQTDTVAGYDQYEPAEVPDSFDDDPPVVAMSADTVVVGPDTGSVRQLLTGGDDGDGVLGGDGVAELFEIAGAGDFVVGELGASTGETPDIREMFDGDPQFEPQTGEAAVASLAFGDDGETVSSQFVLDADNLPDDRRETIETTFGTAAVDDSVTIDVTDGQITASGTYAFEDLGLTGSDAGEAEELSQAEAAELVSPDALAFQYEPPSGTGGGELWVAVTGATDAAALRVEADSGSYTEIRPQDRTVGAGDSVAVRVDPDGDAVTVSVIDNSGAVGELTTQSVPTESLSDAAADRAVPADALSFSYESPDVGDYGSLTVEVVAAVDAETLVARPQNAPGVFTARTGSLAGDTPIETGTTLETAVDPDGDEVVVYATVDDATGEVARWQGPN